MGINLVQKSYQTHTFITFEGYHQKIDSNFGTFAAQNCTRNHTKLLDGANQADFPIYASTLHTKDYFCWKNGPLCQDDPKERAEKLFSACDVNNDGFLTEEEFLKGCRNDTEMMKLLDKLYNYLTEGMDE